MTPATKKRLLIALHEKCNERRMVNRDISKLLDKLMVLDADGTRAVSDNELAATMGITRQAVNQQRRR